MMLTAHWKWLLVFKPKINLNTISAKFYAFSAVFVLSNLIIYMQLSNQSSGRETSSVFIDESFRLKIPSKNRTTHYTPDDGFSGCLVLKDDNDRLSEWLAYHWLVLPLKYLVVAVDPTGTTSPESILKLWNSSNMGMDIVFWNDIDFDHWIDEELDEKHRHRARQQHLYYSCQKYHKERNRTWIALVDPDEYITYNLITPDDPKVSIIRETPDAFMDSKYVSSMKNVRKNLKQVISGGKTVFDFLQDEKNKEPWISEPCYLMPRLFFSAVESGPHLLAEAGVAQFGFNTSRFSTLRYFHHAHRGRFHANHFGKVIIDLSRIDITEITLNMQSIHVPLDRCPHALKPYAAGILRANHYIGSFAQYSSRVDPRRSKEKFNKFGNVNYGSDHQIQNWLKDFIGVVGVEKSKNLLKHAGIVDIGTTRIIETESYKRVPQPPKYYVYYYDINDQIVGRKRLEKGEINNSEFGLDEIVEQNQLK